MTRKRWRERHCRCKMAIKTFPVFFLLNIFWMHLRPSESCTLEEWLFSAEVCWCKGRPVSIWGTLEDTPLGKSSVWGCSQSTIVRFPVEPKTLHREPFSGSSDSSPESIAETPGCSQSEIYLILWKLRWWSRMEYPNDLVRFIDINVIFYRYKLAFVKMPILIYLIHRRFP